MKAIHKIIAAFFLLLKMGCCALPPINTDELPSTALCTRDANIMEKNYITLKDFNNKRLEDGSEHDNRVISFTYEQMISSLWYLAKLAKERNIENKKLGFRVYLGAKNVGDSEDFVKGQLKVMGPEDKGYTTVFFVATEKGESDDPNDYKNIYTIPALNYGGSRRPPDEEYRSPEICPVHGIRH